MKRIIYGTFAILMALTSCSDDNGGSNERRDIPLSRSEEEIKDAQMDFSFRLINSMAKKNRTENWVISPFTSFVNLSLLANGANDEIRDEFVSVLGFPEGATIENVNNYNRKLLRELPTLDRKTSLSIANSNWVSDRCTLVDGFADITNKYYEAPVSQISFEGLLTDYDNPYNKWVSGQIGVPYLMGQSLPEVLSITSSILKFKGEWVSKFNKDKTKKEEFHNYSGETVLVDMMNQVKAHIASHYYSDEADVLRMSFGNISYSIYMFLPEMDINEFVAEFTAEKFKNLKYDTSTKEFILKIPRFNITSDADLTPNLLEMGLVKTIGGNIKGKFSRFYKAAGGSDKESILHSTLVNFGIDEDGAEIKAVSETPSGYLTSPGPLEVLYFTLDRPFFYIVTERSTNTILAAGTVYNL